MAEKINVRVSRSGSLGPRRLQASEAASCIMAAYSNIEADPSKNAPKFRTLDCFGAVDVFLILKSNCSSNCPYVSVYLSIFIDIAGINVKTIKKQQFVQSYKAQGAGIGMQASEWYLD